MKVFLLFGLIAVASGCVCRPHRGEPTDAQLRVLFEGHRPQLDELRKLFEDDVKRVQLRALSASSAEESVCENSQRSLSCLDADRWRRYASGLKSIGALGIERHETPGVYFEVYRNPYWTECFRSKGVVYAPGVSKVVHNHDDTEERVELLDGWFSYLIIDT
jgi:hypothetical protein